MAVVATKVDAAQDPERIGSSRAEAGCGSLVTCGSSLVDGRWLIVDGRWDWGRNARGIFLIRLRVRRIGFVVKFLIFELGVLELQRAAELGAEAGLVPVEAFEGARIVAEVLVGDGGADGGAAGFELFVDLGLLATHLEIHEGGLEGDDAVEAPAGGGQVIDEVELGAGLWLVIGEVLFAKGVELLLGLALDEELAGGESVGEAGGAGAGASLGGDGSVGLGAVGAGGIDASLGRHGGSLGRVCGHRDSRRA